MNRIRDFYYIAYGLGIRSALPLPELLPGEAGADVGVRLGKMERTRSETTATGIRFRATAEECCLIYEGVGAFLVRSGREIVVEPAPGVEERVLRLAILGPVLALLLHQRGRLILHASAVAINGGAVAFLGGMGWGKSTTAASLHTRGHNVVADDVVAVQTDVGHPTVFPGFPQLKLWPEVAVSLGDALETLPRLHPRSEKRARRVTKGFAQHPLPLRHAYVLAEGPAQEIEALRPQEGLMELVRHSYAVGLLRYVGASSHFLQCVSLAKNVPVSRLKRPRSLQELPDLARMVEEDLAHGIA